MIINSKVPYESLKDAFADYEKNLIMNNMDKLDFYFWESDLTVRLGVAENLYGAQSIQNYRRVCAPVNKDRVLNNTVIRTFGDDFGIVSTEFNDGINDHIGRQMQTWVRFNGDWKVVAAHVSMMPVIN